VSEIARLLGANAAYATGRRPVVGLRPSRNLAVVTCMDTRIDVPAVLGLQLGDAHVLRNAGGRVTQDVLRSLAVSTHVLGTETVVVMQHTGCGLVGVSEDDLRNSTGADIEFLTIADHAAALQTDIDLVAATPYLDSVRLVAGFLYDVETGKIHEMARYVKE
jgi:carbonic anhydrase